MKYLKVIFLQALLITVGITFAISLEGLIEHLKGEEMFFQWYMPGSAIVGGIACAIPSALLLMNVFEKTKKQFIIRVTIHCVLLYVINSLIGWLFKWFTTWTGFIFVSISYFAVYVFAWVGGFIINRQEDKEINEALKDIRDDE